MGCASRRVVIVVAAGVLAVGLGGMAAAGAAAAAPTTGQASAALTLGSGPSFNELYGVSAVSRSNAWAVGRQNSTGVFRTLILHWNGTAWSKVNSPSPSLSDAELLGVSAVSGGDAWAAGFYWNGTARAYDSLILHWNGTAWSKIKSPNPSSSANQLYAVSAHSGSDAWAVGGYLANDGLSHALVLHWNGTAWTQVNSPTAPRYTDFGLTGVSAVSGSDAWAVGVHGVPSDGGKSGTLIFHWDGVVWTLVKSPNPGSGTNLLEGVSAVSGSDAWAVGNYSSYLNPGASRTLVLHWNGTAWSKVKSPTPNSVDVNFLYGVSARSGSDAWAVGFYWNGTAGAYDSLILHWNGTAWSRIKSSNPGRFANHLYGVSSRSGSDAWAVGYHDTTVSTTNSLILHWNGTSWAKSPPPK